jgi:hypothetical protein
MSTERPLTCCLEIDTLDGPPRFEHAYTVEKRALQPSLAPLLTGHVSKGGGGCRSRSEAYQAIMALLPHRGDIRR